jgi:TrmH RNA methyltransferase
MKREPPRRTTRSSPPSPWQQTGAATARDPQRSEETRIYGLNACLAAFARRPEALRKVYLTEARIPALKPVLAWCVKHRLGYRIVEETDLEKLTASRHHEGVCFEMLRSTPLDLGALLASQPVNPEPSLLLWLDGVGNPHNLGAILRSAAHFGVSGVLLPEQGAASLSGAAYRVAEGGAEAVPVLRVADGNAAFASLRNAGFAFAATVVRDGEPLYAAAMPARLLLLLGAESEGLPERLSAISDLRLRIPGSGAVESLNVSVAAALCIAEWARVHAARVD